METHHGGSLAYTLLNVQDTPEIVYQKKRYFYPISHPRLFCDQLCVFHD